METSKIKIRPFIPSMKDEEKEGREPFAVLKYGNVEIEIDYTIMRFLSFNVESGCYWKTKSIAKAGFEEILKEMNLHLWGDLPLTHRDGNHPFLKSITNNHLHPINKEIKYITNKKNFTADKNERR